MKKPPTAPPVYRPQLRAAQAKAASNARQNSIARLGPPVYSPQPLPKALQAKAPLTNQGPALKPRQPLLPSGPPPNHVRPNTVKTTPPPRVNGSVQRHPIGRQPVEAKPPNAGRPLVQMKPTAAVSFTRSNAIQRRLRVTNIDFDPNGGGVFRHGTIEGADQATFIQNLKNEINQVARYAGFRGHVNAVIAGLTAAANAGGGLQAADVPGLTTAIADEVINQYGAHGQGAAMGALRNHLEIAITRLLVDRFQVAHGIVMTPAEIGGYDLLRNVVGVDNMSRRKGQASELNHAQLPGPIKTAVDAVLTAIRAERTKWRKIGRRLNIKYFLPAPNEQFCADVCGQTGHYQGNHTNNAGWLPAAAAAPVNAVTTAQANVLAAASAGLTAILNAAGNPLAVLQLGVAGTAPTPFGVEYLGLVAAERMNLNNVNVEASVGAALSQGISSFVEFNMPHAVSRLVWDVVTNDIYISAHYKWRLGYNPWFKINNYPAI